MLNKQKVLEWIRIRKEALEQLSQQHTGYHKRHLTGQHSSLVDIEWEIQEGMFDAEPTWKSEAERLRTENAMLERDNANAEMNLQIVNDLYEQAIKLLKVFVERTAIDGSYTYTTEYAQARNLVRDHQLEK